QRHRYASVEVSRDRTRLQVANELQGVLSKIGPPVVMALDPFLLLFAACGQIEEEMLGLFDLNRPIAAPLMRLDQIDGVELVSAVVALVAARFLVAADGTRALDVAVWQRATAHGVEGAHPGLLDQVALLIQLEKQALCHAIVVARGRAREDVVRHPEPA